MDGSVSGHAAPGSEPVAVADANHRTRAGATPTPGDGRPNGVQDDLELSLVLLRKQRLYRSSAASEIVDSVAEVANSGWP